MCMMNSFKFTFSLLLLICSLAHQLHAQEDFSKFRLDSLSIEEILKRQNDVEFPSFKYDSIQIELFYQKELLAIIPNNLVKELNRKYIHFTEFESQLLGNKKMLLKIKFQLILK